MSDSLAITDEMLTAYLDGELSQEERAELEDTLESNSDVAARLRALDFSVEELQKASDAMLASAPAMKADDLEMRQSSRANVWRWAAVILVGLVLGAWFLRPTTAGWVDAVANYQSLYVTETLAVSEPEAQRETKLAQLSEKIGLDLSPLLGIDTIDYRRAQLLGFSGRTLVQVAYLDGAAPIAICIVSVEGEDTAIQENTLYGLKAASWQKGGYGFLVIGGDDDELIRQLAETVRASI